MSKNSKLYGDLKRRIDYLSAQYLPAHSPTGNYTKKQQDDIRSFLLLSHAEFEYYFEEFGRQIAKRAFDRWRVNRDFKSKVLFYLALHSETTEKIRHAESAGEKMKEIYGQYIIATKRNNGIKKDNILTILCPIGVDLDLIDNTWLNTITSYGADRGEIAHTSARTQTLHDPIDIKNEIAYLIRELSLLDMILLKLR